MSNQNEQLTDERKADLDELAKTGTALGIFDVDTLIDVDEFLKTTSNLPLYIPD